MLPDGVLVPVDSESGFEPDALVYCGAELPADTVKVTSPVIVVEVLSPSTRKIDGSVKMIGYFKIPSVSHYLIIDPGKLPIIHHGRQGDDTILSRIIGAGTVRLDPPGIEFSVDDLLG